MNQNRDDLVFHFFVSATIFTGTVIGGVAILITKEYGQIFISQNIFIIMWLCALGFEGVLIVSSLVALHEANQSVKKYEPALIALLRAVVDSKAFDYYLKSLAKNPSSDELLTGFNEQVALARACLEMVLPSANPSTRALLTGIVSDKINRAVPAKGFEEKWREVVRNAQERLEIKTTT